MLYRCRIDAPRFGGKRSGKPFKDQEEEDTG